MRPLAALALVCLLGPGLAHADAYYAPQVQQPPPKDEFWREVVAPHGDEIQQILDKARMAYQNAIGFRASDMDPTGEHRARLFDDAYGMLRYARRLDPRQKDVLKELGMVAWASGRPAAAIEAYQAYLAELGPDDPVPPDVHVRLGVSYLRTERLEDALRHFRAGMGDQPQLWGEPVLAASYLANALMNAGRISEAIDALAPHANVNNVYAQMQLLVTLAVAYDRDEQISAAFEILEGMRNMLQQNYLQQVQAAVSQLDFAPSYDEHYFWALAYESEGHFAEARTEWLTYAQAEDAPFRARALDHVAAIDKLQAEKLAAAAKAAKAKPPKPPRPARPGRPRAPKPKVP